jgi:hypothetical protein
MGFGSDGGGDAVRSPPSAARRRFQDDESTTDDALSGPGAVCGASSARGAGVVEDGSPASCTDAAHATALVCGDLVTFNCGAGNLVIPFNDYVIASGDAAIVDGSN